jgi:Phosphotransferase enzyme family
MARAKRALAAAGLDPTLALTRASSVTNEVWLSDDFAVRVSRRPDKRLWREARLGPYLPAVACYPEVVGYGTGTGHDWLVTRRNRGNVLSRCWPTMSDAQRRLAVGQISSILRALHATRMPVRLGDVKDLGAPQLLKFGRHVDPVAPLLNALARAAELPFVDPDVMYDLAMVVATSSWTIEPSPARTLVHGDLTFENVLWDGNEVTGIIDFEWARAAPCALELDVLLRFCAYPFMHVADDYEAQTKPEAYEAVPSWLAQDYPELFSAPDLRDRLRVYAIAFEVRQLLMLPPSAPAHELSARHPLPRLLQLLTHRSHLDWIGL